MADQDFETRIDGLVSLIPQPFKDEHRRSLIAWLVSMSTEERETTLQSLERSQRGEPAIPMPSHDELLELRQRTLTRQHEEGASSRPWVPLAEGEIVSNGIGEQFRLMIVDCGELYVPSGRLVVCDPFTDLYESDLRSCPVLPGRYNVKVTMFDSLSNPGWNKGVAFASVILTEGEEVTHRTLPLLSDGEPMREANTEDEEGLTGEGTLCFVDREAVEYGMPPDKTTWHEELLFGAETGWGNLLLQREAETGGLILPLPLATNGANIFLMSTAGSEGTYPLVGGYAKNGNLIRLHVECFWF
jgi:hypothetical protein